MAIGIVVVLALCALCAVHVIVCRAALCMRPYHVCERWCIAQLLLIPQWFAMITQSCHLVSVVVVTAVNTFGN
jgi:uncharacterized membrane protein YhaH (DUF805 family)